MRFYDNYDKNEKGKDRKKGEEAREMQEDDNNSKMFEQPKSVFQHKINSIMTDNPTKKLILDIFELQQFKNADKDENKLAMVELYNLLGFEKFVEVVELMSGRTVKFPLRDDFKESIEIALTYYYRTFRGYEWGRIRELIGDTEISSIKFGSKIQQLSKFINYIGDRIRARELNIPLDNKKGRREKKTDDIKEKKRGRKKKIPENGENEVLSDNEDNNSMDVVEEEKDNV